MADTLKKAWWVLLLRGKRETLRRNIQLLEDERNATQATVTWLFSSEDARVKLARLYPSISD